MTPSDEIEVLRARHDALRRRMPNVWTAFFAKFGSLRPVQLQAMPPILDGASLLVTAPTAGGKTEAVAAPVCERLVSGRWSGLSVILITPTRALVNDLYERLCRPCDELRIRLARKTADHALSERSKDQFLITTPESTESLLTFRRHLLNDVRAIILDEIHLLDGSPRGDQLRCVLQRLIAYRRHIAQNDGSVQRIALSATVSDPQRLARTYLGADASVTTVPGQREIDSNIIIASGNDEARAHAAIDAAAGFNDARKVLVFVNSRKQVDTAASFAHGRFARYPVYGHHGSLSKARREEVEERFRRDERALCVATMTLEVGIDIGDIDLVVCMDPPFSLASFLQRIGRGCRRLQGRTRVLCVARDRVGEVIFRALINQASLGMTARPLTPFRRSVLVQQILAYLRQVDHFRRTREQSVRVLSSDLLPSIPAAWIDETLRDMAQNQLIAQRADVHEPASNGWAIINSDRIYTNITPTPPEVALVDVETGETLGTVAGVETGANRIALAGQQYDIVPGGGSGTIRVRSGDGPAPSPRYHARSLPYAFDIGVAIREFLGLNPPTLAVIRRPGSLFLMTWLGRLLNEVVACGFAETGVMAKAATFAVRIDGVPGTEVLKSLVRAVSIAPQAEGLAGLRPERLSDLGPYFDELSPESQVRARRESIDFDFLSNWAASVSVLREIPPGTAEEEILASLAAVR